MIEFSKPVQPDGEALIANLARKGTPQRVHFMELFLDGEIQEAICQRCGVVAELDRADPFFAEKRQIALQRFLGYDYVGAGIGIHMPTSRLVAPDTAELARAGGRSFIDEHRGPITNWEEFEKYPWADVAAGDSRSLDWYEKNLPDDMCVISGGNAHFCEWLCWLMGYETLCYALYDNRALVGAMYDKILQIATSTLRRLASYKRVKAVWGSDDMGFKTGTLLSPPDMREFVLAGHKACAEIAHRNGWLYLVHACGNLRQIMPDLIEDVKIDAKHSFEDTIQLVSQAKAQYGSRIALIGGIDVDFLCRSDEQAIRRRVRTTLEACLNGGGYCLGTGNSVANYIPLDNYLAMMDEGRRYA